jgi:hypothetical protein
MENINNFIEQIKKIVKMGATTSSKKEIHFNELNEVQLGLLRMFSRPMSREKTLKLKRAIVSFLSEELDKEVENAVERKKITLKDYEALKRKHQRTPKK